MKKTKIFLVILCLFACIASSLVFGARYVSIESVIEILQNPEMETFEALVVKERIPRTIFAMIAGAALAVSGTLMQSVTRNPIADPSILGINTGASLAVVMGIAFLGISTYKEYIILALVGAVLTAAMVYFVASLGAGGMSPIKLALSGVIISALLSSMVSIVMLPRSEVVRDFRFWQIGGVGGAGWEEIASALPVIIIGFILSIAIAPSLNALALGEEVATGLGVNVGLTRMVSSISAIMLCATVTALAGPIAFIGLMAPHMIRMLFGNNIRFLIPVSALTGAVLLTFSDVVGRLVAYPGELDVGVVTAFIGAPIFILIAMKAKVRSL